MSKKILIISQFYLPGFKAGGPIRSISNLVEAFAGDYNFSILTGDRDLQDVVPYKDLRLNDWLVNNKVPVYHIRLGLLESMRGILQLRKFDLIYLNSFFDPRFSIAPLLFSLMMGKKVIIAPRGEFSPGALELKESKKKQYIKMFRKFGLHHKITWHATNDAEKRDIESVYGTQAKIMIAPNLSSKGLELDLLRKINKIKPDIKSTLNLVFISRISEKKNLAFAIHQLSKLDFPVAFAIYGPLEDRTYLSKCQQIVKTLPNHIQVTFEGELPHSKIAAVFQRSHFLFFPTKGENYGHVIAESLQNGCPVILSNNHPWDGLEEYSAGWSISLETPNKFEETFHQIGQLSPKTYHQYSEGALKYWQHRYSEDAKSSKSLYHNLFNA